MVNARHLFYGISMLENCKHEFAAMLQLKETLEKIEKHYTDEYERTDYFAAVNKGTLFVFAIDSKEAETLHFNKNLSAINS